jgi:hypothetical protein
VRGEAGGAPSVRECRIEEREQLRNIERLRQVPAGALGEEPFDPARRGVRAQDDHGNLPGLGIQAQTGEDLVAREVGETDLTAFDKRFKSTWWSRCRSAMT